MVRRLFLENIKFRFGGQFINLKLRPVGAGVLMNYCMLATGKH